MPTCTALLCFILWQHVSEDSHIIIIIVITLFFINVYDGYSLMRFTGYIRLCNRLAGCMAGVRLRNRTSYASVQNIHIWLIAESQG